MDISKKFEPKTAVLHVGFVKDELAVWEDRDGRILAAGQPFALSQRQLWLEKNLPKLRKVLRANGPGTFRVTVQPEECDYEPPGYQPTTIVLAKAPGLRIQKRGW